MSRILIDDTFIECSLILGVYIQHSRRHALSRVGLILMDLINLIPETRIWIDVNSTPLSDMHSSHCLARIERRPSMNEPMMPNGASWNIHERTRQIVDILRRVRWRRRLQGTKVSSSYQDEVTQGVYVCKYSKLFYLIFVSSAVEISLRLCPRRLFKWVQKVK